MGLGIKRLRIELIREHGLRLALDTVHKVLVRQGERYLKRQPLRRKGTSLGDELGEWQTFFNWQRPHSALGGSRPSGALGAPATRLCSRRASPRPRCTRSPLPPAFRLTNDHFRRSACVRLGC